MLDFGKISVEILYNIMFNKSSQQKSVFVEFFDEKIPMRIIPVEIFNYTKFLILWPSVL
jgi:hypothetical protein